MVQTLRLQNSTVGDVGAIYFGGEFDLRGLVWIIFWVLES
jgi:hypothetical protein